MDLKSEIQRRLETLPPDVQREFLAQLESYGQVPIKGKTPADMLSFAGRLDDQSAAEMI